MPCFSTTATGGYSTKQASVAYWNSPFIEYVIAIFMILSGINFSLYFMCMKGRCGQLFKDGELRLYLISIGAVTLIITGALYWYNNYGLEEAFRKSLFRWRPFIRRVALLRTIIICGLLSRGCCLFIRWWQEAVPVLRRGCQECASAAFVAQRENEFHRLMHPRAVLPVKMNRMAVSQRTLATVMTFVFFYLSVSFMLAGADVHGHRTGRIFRTICIKYR